jgi:excisionase family DNA binding protein
MAVMRGEKLLTASDLAALCEVDLKTIHNWVDRGRIAHFRTPGRHLRFRAADVAEFLRTWGYTVPRELARATARTVVVVGSTEAMAHVSRALEGVPLKHAAHPYDALVYAGADPADVHIIDITSVAPEIDAGQLLDALHRACPQSTFVALADEVEGLPQYATRVGRFDTAALKALILPQVGGARAPAAAVEEQAQPGSEPAPSSMPSSRAGESHA